MSAFDLFILVVVIAMTLRGVMKGMISQIVSVLSYIVCWIVASRCAFLIAPSIPAEEPWNQIGAIVVLFVITMIGMRFVHSFLEGLIKCLRLATLNRLLGGLLGLAKATIICMVLTFLGVMVSTPTRSLVLNSKCGPPLVDLITRTGAILPKESCELIKTQIEIFRGKISQVPQTNAVVDDPILAESDLFSSLTGQLRHTVPASGGSDSSSIGDLLTRSGKMLEETQAIQSEIQQKSESAASLVDGIRRWWNGSSSEPKKEGGTADNDSTSNLKSASPILATDLPFGAMSSALDSGSDSVARSVQGQQSVSVVASSSNHYREESMLNRLRLSGVELPLDTSVPVTTESGLVLPIESRAMSIPRSSANFYLPPENTTYAPPASEHLLDNSTAPTSASSNQGAAVFTP